MLRRPFSSACLAALLLAAGAAQAAEVARVDIRGLDEEMTENVRVSLSLVEALGRDVPPRRLVYMVREAESQTREALEPFGYYSPTIEVERERSDDGLAVTITVDPGEPVRVRNSDIAILGAGHRDRYLQEDLGEFAPSPGSVFDHALYEASKARISRRLAERGYFDADFSARRVEVTRAERAADIELVWTSGERYDMGPIDFSQEPESVVNDSLLERLVYWDEGDYYHQGRLDRLRTSLTRLDYFSRIEISTRPEDAGPDRRVPVEVTLTPAPRKVQTAGISYGTDSGAGVRLGEERRYVNRRGHKALAQLDYAQRRKTLTLQYRIPAFAWLDGWYTASLQVADEQTDYIDTRRVELVASRSGQYNRHLNLVASAHVLRERWAYVEENGDDPEAEPDYRYATFSYPSLRGEYIDVDDRIFPTRGIGGSLVLRGGVEGAGSDASFAQLHARATWYRGLGARNRLIVRGELGHTSTDALVALPPSLRFYAGGDRSIRGYDWREVGPRLGDFALGAKNVTTASVELEHYFANAFGIAGFVDSGSAFDDSPDFRTGVGIGVRWRSPVGPLRLDIARGLDDPDSPFTLHLDIGTAF
ncbi:autotransporter assembly complex protein TamA [Luteimonas sp. RD2P54]|uniref:Translocation and assembly module subunit TamA n=1 Tax=Luteimonas endophytica TaxID=3042023 RepID=A0ABT6J5F0_9GAMM|nr:autotransporter assembly complex family protein [Luteimonas endophytica]MDH5822061.1 autotransporter assembly complex protein TamA [Luteimonas endophytica]